MEARSRTVANAATSAAPPSALPPASAVSNAIQESVPSQQQQHQALDDISASIQRSLALLHQLHCSVSSFSLPSQLTVLERLNGVMKELSVVHSAADDCHFQIPIDVIRLVDDGKNPDEFTKDLINNCIQRNQATKGKVDAFKALRKHLLEEIEDAYPEETEAYRALRKAAVLEARRSSQAPALLANGDVKVKTEH